MKRLLVRDEGVSLAELLAVMALMGLVLAGAWALVRLVNIGSTQTSQEAWNSREIGQPLEHAERAMSQLVPPIIEVGEYSCKIRTDVDHDNKVEFRTFRATADGHFTEEFYEEGSAAIVTPDIRTWSHNNANVSSSTPLFRFLDIDGKDISDLSAVEITQSAASVVVTVVTVHDGKQYQGSRQVYFRNR